MPSSLLGSIDLVGAEQLELLKNPWIWVNGLALAFVASAETLLCATAVDGMQDGPRTDYDRELFAQGVGNLCCGVLGATPTTGVITRSTANVQAGAKSRTSGILVGVWILIVLAWFSSSLEVIPLASLAGLLVYVGYKLVRYRPYADLKSHGRTELIAFFITLAVIVGWNLLTGILVGILLTALKLFVNRGKQFHRLDIEVREEEGVGRTHIHLRGAASFIRLPRLAATLEKLPRNQEVHLHVEELEYIDHACLDLLTKWERDRIGTRSPVRVQWQTLRHRYHKGNVLDETPDEHAQQPKSPPLLDFLAEKDIHIGLEFTDPWDAIEQLCRSLVDQHPDIDFTALHASVQQREREASTCIGAGLMIPHAVLPEGTPMLGSMAISSSGFAFNGPDEKPVRCVVLLLTPENESSKHLAVLAAFAQLFSLAPELRERLLNAPDSKTAYDLLHSPEATRINYPFESNLG